jgi:cytosine/adenosine deaminase-related metal-dependent hydrolase
MLRRRRPVLRAATMVGAGAAVYHAGKSAQAGRDQDAYRDQQLEYQDDQIRQLQAQQAYVQPAPTAASGVSPDMFAQLERLAQLKEKGVLTSDEFEAQKRKVLGG